MNVKNGMKKMKTQRQNVVYTRVVGLVAWSLFLCLGLLAASQENSDAKGRLYVMTNRAPANSIVALRRNSDGSLTRIEEVLTGGSGSGPGALPARFGGGPGPDPLTSSDSLILTHDHRFLIAANAGSNELSVLAVEPEGLRLVCKVSSGGEFPVSIAIHGALVYVLNQRGSPNITGFFLQGDGKLQPIDDSTQPAGSPGSSASEIAFSPDGHFLLLSETLANLIHVFRMDDDGHATDPLVITSANHTPSAVAFFDHGRVAVTEAAEIATQTGAPNGSTTSTYHLQNDGSLQLISKSVPDEKTATCWIRFTRDARFAYVSSMGSGSISSYSVAPDGELTLLNAEAADTGGLFSVPLDLAMSNDSQFLYVVAGLAGTIEGFHIEQDGSLTPVASVKGFPVSTQGIASN